MNKLYLAKTSLRVCKMTKNGILGIKININKGIIEKCYKKLLKRYSSQRFNKLAYSPFKHVVAYKLPYFCQTHP